jgi:hypothetical protein
MYIEKGWQNGMNVLPNYPLWAALSAIILAQLIKIPLYYLPNRTWNFSLVLSTGGMPSSHSAAVTALATAVFIEHGPTSTYFAIAVVLSLIVMFDAAGIRRHAGEHAVVLNRLIDEMNQLVKEMKNWSGQTDQVRRKKLKELLGHQPIEVLIGAVLGIGMALLLGWVWEKI